jgi:hypothetical protein
MDQDAPVSYMTLQPGTPVFASDGIEVGTVSRVLADRGTHIFDGIVISSNGLQRFVDAPEVARITAGGVTLTIDADAARRLPPPGTNPAVVAVDPRSATRLSHLWRRGRDRFRGRR